MVSGAGSVMGLRVPVWLVLALATFGCNDEKPTPAGSSGSGGRLETAGLRESCTDGQTCEAGLLCVELGEFSYCEQPCQSDADCDFKLPVDAASEATAVCATLSPELKVCKVPCDGHYEGAYACMDHHPVYCAALDETSCSVCGCPDGMRCEANVGCEPKRGLDAECFEDADCASNNCDFFEKVCRVPVGSPCTPTNCEQCMESRYGTFCSRKCGGDHQCNGSACAFQECVPLCAGPVDPKCLGECDFHFRAGPGSPEIYSCDCDPMECVQLYPPAEPGAQCDEDSDCDPNGVCLVQDAFRIGFCSRTCSADSPCDKGQSCVDVPCGQSDPDTCGLLCLNACQAAEPRCYPGHCRALQSVDAQVVEVCDFRKLTGERCNAHGDCQSGVCMDAACAE